MISTHPESNNAWGKSRSFKTFSHGKEAKNNVFPGFRAHRSGDFPPRAPSAPHAALRRHPRWALTRHTYSAAGIPMPSGSAAIPASGSPPASASINAFCAKHAPVCGGHTRADPIIAVPRRTRLLPFCNSVRPGLIPPTTSQDVLHASPPFFTDRRPRHGSRLPVTARLGNSIPVTANRTADRQPDIRAEPHRNGCSATTGKLCGSVPRSRDSTFAFGK